MIKKTNMEHFRSEIEKYGYDFTFRYGKIERCDRHLCAGCEFNKGYNCSVQKIEWLMSEYKEEPVLTQREKGFLECIGGGWISRESDGALYWSDMKPGRGVKDYWFDCESNYTTLDADYFSFVTWDERPWTVTDLLKLKVRDE